MPMATTKFPVSQPSCPWLVFNHGEKEGYSTQTVVNVAQDYYDVARIPEMRNKLICTSCHGWLVLLDKESFNCFLLNPVSMEKIMLPQVSQVIPFITCILSSAPTGPDCAVIFLRSKTPCVTFLRLGESEWIEQDLISEEIIRQAIVCGGKIYGFNFPGYLCTVKIVGSNLVVTQLGVEEIPMYTIPDAFRRWFRLVESCGELFAVVKYYLGGTMKTRHIEVYKMDFPRLAWTKVESLGNRAFFLAGTSCNFSGSAVPGSGVKQNCIYFLESGDRDLHVFDMENYDVTISTPCPVKSNWLQPTWVMPAPSISAATKDGG